MSKMGSIEIPIEVDDKDLQKELDRSKRKIEKFDKDTERMTTKKEKLEIDTTKTMADLQKIDNKMEEISREMERIREAKPFGLDTNQDYQKLAQEAQYLDLKAQESYQKLDLIKSSQADITNKIEQTAQLRKEELANINNIVNKADELKDKQVNVDNATKAHDKSLSKIISKVGKWALAVFGVRSAYQFVRQAASTIGQYDKQIGADIQYIRYALAFTLKPVIEWLIKAAYTILQYVGAIIYRLTGYNIFQNSGVKQFKSSMSGAEKSSKKIKDNLSASFDEFNALSKQDTSSGAGSEGAVTPSMDLSKLKQIELPKWLNNLIDFVKENKDTILKILETAFALFTIKKVASWISPVLSMFTGKGAAGGLFGGSSGGSGGLTGVIGKLGIIAASCYAISEINDKVKKDNEKQNKDLKKISEQGTKYAKEDAKNFKNIDEMQDSLNYKRKYGNELLDKSLSFGAAITHTSGTLRDNVKDNVKQQDLYLQEQIKNYRQGKLNKEDQDKLKQILLDQLEYNVQIGDLLEFQGEDAKEIRDYGIGYKDVLKEMGVILDKWPSPFEKMKEDSEFVKEHTGDIVKDIANLANRGTIKLRIEADAKNAGLTLKEFAMNFAKIITAPLNAVGAKGLSDFIINKVKSIKLASGGIINNPGRGVPVGMAIAGEAGREGVIPLTDSRAMAELGQEIGKYVNINNMVNNYIDSRKLNQIMAKSQNRDNFARNG